MNKFKIGDKAKIINLEASGGNREKIGEIVTIIDITESGKYYGRFQDKTEYYLEDSELESLTKTPIMSLSFIENILLSPDVKTLKKAGFLNGDLELTDIGNKALMSLLFNANKEQLVKLAEEKLSEEIECKSCK